MHVSIVSTSSYNPIRISYPILNIKSVSSKRRYKFCMLKRPPEEHVKEPHWAAWLREHIERSRGQWPQKLKVDGWEPNLGQLFRCRYHESVFLKVCSQKGNICCSGYYVFFICCRTKCRVFVNNRTAIAGAIIGILLILSNIFYDHMTSEPLQICFVCSVMQFQLNCKRDVLFRS